MYFKYVHCRLNHIKLFLIVVCACTIGPRTTFADTRIGIDLGTLQENRSASQLSSIGRSLYDGYLQVGFKSGLPLYLNLGYLYTDSVENYSDASFTTVTTTNPYVGASYIVWDKNIVSIVLSGLYSPFVKSTLSESSGSESWEGSAYAGKISLSFNTTKAFKINTSLYYINQTFSTKTAGSVTTKTSFSQSFLMPSLGIAFAF